jgi:uncharacterized protein (TIGR03086 family)
MSTDLLESAIASTRGVLKGVTASQLCDSTPCAQWNVGQLVNHIVGDQFFFVGIVAGEIRDNGPSNFSAGDFLATFEIGSSLCVQAFAGEEVMNEKFTLPSFEMTGSSLVRVVATDTFVHGWDLARATGQSTDLSPDLATKLLVAAKLSIPPIVRCASGSPFAPEQTASVGASEADRLAAYFGRRI